GVMAIIIIVRGLPYEMRRTRRIQRSEKLGVTGGCGCQKVGASARSVHVREIDEREVVSASRWTEAACSRAAGVLSERLPGQSCTFYLIDQVRRSFEVATDSIPASTSIVDCSEQSNIVRLAVMIDSSPRHSQNILVCQRTLIRASATAAGVDAAHRLIIQYNGGTL